MRILFTRATGFIGRHLVARLRQDGYVVLALAYDPGGPTICPEGVESVIGGVCDAQAIIERHQLQQWVHEGVIEWWEH
jgi:nucleoside-diphosphate-sugar epimerase